MLVNNAHICQLFLNVLHNLPAQVGISHLTPPEHHGYLHLIVLAEKFLNMFDLYLQVMFIRLWSYPYLFYLNGALTFFSDLQLLALLVSEFSIIHDPANWR